MTFSENRHFDIELCYAATMQTALCPEHLLLALRNHFCTSPSRFGSLCTNAKSVTWRNFVHEPRTGFRQHPGLSRTSWAISFFRIRLFGKKQRHYMNKRNPVRLFETGTDRCNINWPDASFKETNPAARNTNPNCYGRLFPRPSLMGCAPNKNNTFVSPCYNSTFPSCNSQSKTFRFKKAAPSAFFPRPAELTT